MKSATKFREFTFDEMSDVLRFLENADIFVPFRSEGRTTEHTEHYSIVTFLRYAKSQLFSSFPCRLVHKDKPDFRLLSAVRSVGIEVTEMIPEQLARASSLLERYFPNGGILEPELFGWDAPERNDSEILAILEKSQGRLTGPPSCGKSIEEKWCHGVWNCIQNKSKKLNKNEFEKFDNNWLLIYDNQLRIFLDKEYVAAKLSAAFDNCSKYEQEIFFDKVIIESGEFFFIIEGAFVYFELISK